MVPHGVLDENRWSGYPDVLISTHYVGKQLGCSETNFHSNSSSSCTACACLGSSPVAVGVSLEENRPSARSSGGGWRLCAPLIISNSGPEVTTSHARSLLYFFFFTLSGSTQGRTE